MTPHKWAKEIKAWADGAEIEIRQFDGDENFWSDWKFWSNNKGVTVNFLINEGIEYRIKPKPKEPQYLYAYFNKTNSKIELDCVECDLGFLEYLGKIPLITEVDDDN